jgi:hypothetical protein
LAFIADLDGHLVRILEKSHALFGDVRIKDDVIVMLDRLGEDRLSSPRLSPGSSVLLRFRGLSGLHSLFRLRGFFSLRGFLGFRSGSFAAERFLSFRQPLFESSFEGLNVIFADDDVRGIEDIVDADVVDGAEVDRSDVLGALDQLVVLLRNDHEGLAFRLEGGRSLAKALVEMLLRVRLIHHDQAFDGFLRRGRS